MKRNDAKMQGFLPPCRDNYLARYSREIHSKKHRFVSIRARFRMHNFTEKIESVW